ncbi:unnamed protein product [Closterium sp. NIES-54]
MASLRVLAFDHEGRPVAFDTWHDDLQLYLLSDSKDTVSLFDHVSGVAPAPPATADSSTRSQTAHALYDAVVARYSSPATATLGTLLLPYLFPELSAFATVADLVTHLRTSNARYRATVPAEFLATKQPPMFITLYFIVSRLPDSLRSVRDHFLTLDPTSLTVDLLEQHLLAPETSAIAVGAACGTPRSPFFEGCSPSPLSPSFAFAAAADVSVAEDVGAASTSAKRRSSKGKGGRGGVGGSGVGGGGSGSGGGGSGGGGGGSEGGGSGGTGGGSGGSGGGGGGSGGSGGSGGGGTGGVQRGPGGGSESCPYVIRTGVCAGQTCGRLHTEHRCFARLDDAWRAEFGDDVERPHWAELLRSRVSIFDVDCDAIISAMYALSFSAEGDSYQCLPPDPVRLQLRERFGQDLFVMRLHSDTGGEFSSNLLRDFCHGEGILQSFTLPDSPQQNGITERRIGLVIEVARTSMIHAPAPHFLWPFARDYELHSLDFSTAFLQCSLHEEIGLHRPPGFTGTFPQVTQWSLRRPVYGLRQAPHEWHDTLRTTLAALGFAPSTADPSLFLRTDTSLLPFYVLVYVDDLVFATADTEALTLVKSELQKRHTCTDLGELRSSLGLQITRDRARRTITLTQSLMVHQVLQHFGFQFSSPQPTLLTTSHSLSAPPLNDTSGMGLVLRGRGPVVLTGHADASWELCWLTYLLTDLVEQPRSPPILYVDSKAMIALCQEHRLEHRTKHIVLRYFLARELQQRGQLCLAYVATRANTADVFTKALPLGDHQRFATVLGLVPALPHLLTA